MRTIDFTTDLLLEGLHLLLESTRFAASGLLSRLLLLLLTLLLLLLLSLSLLLALASGSILVTRCLTAALSWLLLLLVIAAWALLTRAACSSAVLRGPSGVVVLIRS